MRSRARLGLLMVIGGAAACGNSQQSFIVVTVQSADSAPITQVAELLVTVTNGASSQTLTYPAPNQVPFTITGAPDAVTTGKIGMTFSVSFSTSHANDVVVEVSALDPLGAVAATGQATTQIKTGGVGSLTVELQHRFPGCDPAALICGAAMTCAVDCAHTIDSCVAAGTGAPGSLCAQNTDCAPGTQCFAYGGASTPGCQLAACLQFCNSDADCGNGGTCTRKVSCASGTTTLLTGYQTCTFACDPRGDATTGCPAGLHCFVVDAMDRVDCACTQAMQTKVEGQDCASGAECAPGLICTAQCHKLCKLSASNADCGAGQTCSGLAGDQIYGVCLP